MKDVPLVLKATAVQTEPQCRPKNPLDCDRHKMSKISLKRSGNNDEPKIEDKEDNYRARELRYQVIRLSLSRVDLAE